MTLVDLPPAYVEMWFGLHDVGGSRLKVTYVRIWSGLRDVLVTCLRGMLGYEADYMMFVDLSQFTFD